MGTKSKVPRWGRALRRARDLVGLALFAVAYVFRNRAARQRWQRRQLSLRRDRSLR